MRPRSLAIVVLLVVAACGGGSGNGTSADEGGPDPARDKEIAEAVAFHQYDFAGGWEEVNFAAEGSPPTMETLSQCLGSKATPSATALRGYHYGPGINQLAHVDVRVMKRAEDAAAAIAPTVKPEFATCVVEKVKGLLSTALGADLVLNDLTGTATTVASGAANGVAIDMTARITSPRGQITSYPAAVFLQRARTVAIVTLLSNNVSMVDLSRTLSAAVANRMPPE
jgi:hypothetical protein